MEGLSGMVTARWGEAGLVMARFSQTPTAPGESVLSPAAAARLLCIGIDPAITGEPPEERALEHTAYQSGSMTSVEPDGWARERLRQRAVVCRPLIAGGSCGKRGGTAV